VIPNGATPVGASYWGYEQQCVQNSACNYYTFIPVDITTTQLAVANATTTGDYYNLVGQAVVIPTDSNGNPVVSSQLSCVQLPCPNRGPNCTNN